MNVNGIVAGHCATIQLLGENVYTYGNKDSVVSRLDAPYRPVVPVRSVFGVNGAAWGLVIVNVNGDITVTHRYGPSSIIWAFVDISVTFTTRG